MSMSINVLMFDWKVLVDHLVDYGCDNRQVVEDVLDLFGEKICDKYVILSTDYYGDLDPMFALSCAIETLFDIEDGFDLVYEVDHEYIGGADSANNGDKDDEVSVLMDKLERGD